MLVGPETPSPPKPLQTRQPTPPTQRPPPRSDNWPWIVDTYRTMGARIAAAVDAAAAPAPRCDAASKPAAAAAVPIVAVSRADSDDCSSADADADLTPSVDQEISPAQITAGADASARSVQGEDARPVQGADVHVDHLALAASIQMQAEGLFRMTPEARKKLDDLEVGVYARWRWFGEGGVGG